MTQQEFFTRYTYNTRTDKLGGGAFGTVYKAYDNVLDKYVAIKISEVKTIGGKEFSLMDEFNAIKGLSDHTNIAKYEQLFSFDQPNGVFDFAIIQYYPDGNLKDLIKNEKLTQTEKENIAKQILEGLSFLHHHKVVHRDMKPSNILIHKREGKNYIPKIADFGLSKKADPNAKSRFTNSFGGGTLEYSSPEQLRGQNLRFNTDLWAWAVIVYELFTEKPLFQPKNNNTASAENEKEIFEQILNKDISSSLKDIPTNWSNALLACLDRNPETRIKTANEIYDILNSSKTKSDAKPKEDETKVFEEEIKNELKQKEEQTKVFEEEVVKKEKKKNYKFLYITIPILLIVLFFLNSWYVPFEPKEVGYNENIEGIKRNWFGLKRIYYSDGDKSNFKYKEVHDLGIDNLVMVETNNDKYLLDIVNKCRPSDDNGLIKAKSNNKFGYVNYEGKIIIPIIYDSIDKFIRGSVNVSLNGESFLINEKGIKIINKNDIVLKAKINTNFSETRNNEIFNNNLIKNRSTDKKIKTRLYNLINDYGQKFNYFGEIKNNLPDGFGTANYEGGYKYIGNWKNGKQEGYGKSYYHDGNKWFEGTWKNGNLVEGIQYWSTGKYRYQGEYKNGTRDGYGKEYDKDGNLIYSGNWKNGYKENN